MGWLFSAQLGRWFHLRRLQLLRLFLKPLEGGVKVRWREVRAEDQRFLPVVVDDIGGRET